MDLYCFLFLVSCCIYCFFPLYILRFSSMYCIYWLSISYLYKAFNRKLNLNRCRDSRMAKSTETKEGWSHKTSIQPPTGIFFYNTRILKKRYVGGCILNCFMWSSLPCLCTYIEKRYVGRVCILNCFMRYPSLVSVLFAVLLSLHLVTF